MIKAIIFDFDGVILESAVIKTEAFGEVVKNYPKEQADAFVKYHMSHMGISRHVKFKYFIEEILQERYTEEKEKSLADKFENIVFDKVMTCDYVPGAKEFLEKNSKKYDLFIASGTPDEEIQRIVDRRGLQSFFKLVYGSPLKKTEIINRIMMINGYLENEMVFVGDADTDRRAADITGVVFIGRNTPENITDFNDVEYKVDNLMAIEDVIKILEDN